MQPTGQRVEDLMEYIAEHHAEAMRALLAGKEALWPRDMPRWATRTRPRRARR
jgi:hypothetical protein